VRKKCGVTSGFRRGVSEILALLGCYAAWSAVSDASGSHIVSSSWVKQSKSNILLSLLHRTARPRSPRSHTHGAAQTDVSPHSAANTHGAPQTDVSPHSAANTHGAPQTDVSPHSAANTRSHDTRFTNCPNTGDVTSFVTRRSRLQSAALLKTRCAVGLLFWTVRSNLVPPSSG